MARPPKKSETLELRLPYPTKQAFMARCQADGRSASEAIRAFIEAEVGERPRPKRRTLAARLAVGALLAAAAGAAAAPSLAHTDRAAACAPAHR
jgi:hypothetical protein